MKQAVFGDFWIIVALIVVVNYSANVLDNIYAGLSGILRVTLVILLVPVALSKAAKWFLLLGKRYRIAEELFRVVIPFRCIVSLIPIKNLGRLYLLDLFLLGSAISEQHRYKEAFAFSEQAVRFAEKRFGKDSLELAECLIIQCGLLHLTGEFSAAETIGQRAVTILENKSSSLNKQQTESLCHMLNDFGIALTRAGKPDKASEILARSLDLKEKVFGKDHPTLEIAYNNQGDAFLKAGNYVAAETSLKHALKLGDQKGTQNMLVRGAVWNNLGDALRGKGELLPAEQALNEGLRIKQSTLPKTHPHMAYSYNNLGKLYCDQNKFEEATAQFEKALRLRESISPNHPDVADTLNDYAKLLHKMGKTAEAERLEKRAQEIIGTKSDSKASTKQKYSRGIFTTFLIRGIAGMIILVLFVPVMLFSLNTPPPQKVPDGQTATRYYELGVQYKWAGWIEQSRDSLNRAIKLDPNGKTGLLAARYLKTKVPRYPVPEEAAAMNIKAYNESDKSEAKKIFEECINKFPNFEWPYLNLGSLYLKEGNTGKAKEFLNKTLAINPYSEEAWFALANAKRKEKDFAGANECINKAIDLECDPNDKSTKDTKVLVEKLLKFFPR